MKGRIGLIVSLALFGLLLMPGAGTGRIAWAGTKSNITALDRADRAADVFRELTITPYQGIPKEVLENAQGIAVIPRVVRAAVGIGGRWGKGLISVRQRNGAWSAPAFISLAGGSFGFQFGGEAVDVVLVFNNRQEINSLLSSKLKLGEDASVAAGPVGRMAGAGTGPKLESAIYSYYRSRGLFAGVALNGAVISIDNHADHKIYGRDISGRDILLSNKVATSVYTAPFVRALDRYIPSTARSAQIRGSSRRMHSMMPSS
jgi:lipid-binding SYLF domain-containing protein